jgi:hypothetical protein
MHGLALYLDFDGVLHDADVYRDPARGIVIRRGVLFAWAPVLVEALQPWPEVHIVLSTSWVWQLGYARARGYLPRELRERVVGATFHRREHGPTAELRRLWAQSDRGQQIAADVARRMPQGWLAIDDAADEFDVQQREWLLPCDPRRGLSSPETQAALRTMLERAHAGL